MRLGAANARRLREAVRQSERTSADAGLRPAAGPANVGTYFRFARVTGAAAAGLYPATLTAYDAGGAAWADAEAVKLLPLNGEALSPDVRHLATPAGGLSGGVPLYLAIASCCPGSGGEGPGCECVDPALCYLLTVPGSGTMTLEHQAACSWLPVDFDGDVGWGAWNLFTSGPGLGIPAGQARLGVTILDGTGGGATYESTSWDCATGGTFALAVRSGTRPLPPTVTLTVADCPDGDDLPHGPCDTDVTYCLLLAGLVDITGCACSDANRSYAMTYSAGGVWQDETGTWAAYLDLWNAGSAGSPATLLIQGPCSSATYACSAGSTGVEWDCEAGAVLTLLSGTGCDWPATVTVTPGPCDLPPPP